LQSLQLHAITTRSRNAVTVHNLRRQGADIALLHSTGARFSLLKALDIRLHACHIPEVENVLIDALSRLERTGDCELRTDIYQHATAILQVRRTVFLLDADNSAKFQTFVALSQEYEEE
jgi:hypothetical protein